MIEKENEEARAVVVSIVLLVFREDNKAYSQCPIRKIRNLFVHDATENVLRSVLFQMM